MSKNPTPAELIREEVLSMNAYHVPPAQNDVIKLNAMENPYAWPEALVEQWLHTLNKVAHNRYPDPGASRLKASIKSTFELPNDCDILLGNGSDELIQLLIMTVARENCVVLAPAPTFVMYEHCSAALRTRYVAVDLTPDFQLDVDAFLAAIAQHNPAIVFIAYPNNPTGNLFERAHVDRIVEAAPGVVVLDEAYEAFAGRSYVDGLAKHRNLLVQRTLSKSGFAGLRLGYLVGATEWLGEMEKLRLPYNVNVLSQVTGEFALEHYDVFRAQTEQITRDRSVVIEQLSALDGVTPFDSQSNFILFRVVANGASDVIAGLAARGVLAKSFDGTHPLLKDCLRVTVGTPDENHQFLSALGETMQSLKRA